MRTHVCRVVRKGNDDLRADGSGGQRQFR